MNCPKCKREVEMLKFTTTGAMCWDCHEAERKGTPAVAGAAICYAYAIVLLDTLAIKKFQNREDFKGALTDIGDRPKVILKWHDGAKQWTQPEIYA